MDLIIYLLSIDNKQRTTFFIHVSFLFGCCICMHVSIGQRRQPKCSREEWGKRGRNEVLWPSEWPWPLLNVLPFCSCVMMAACHWLDLLIEGSRKEGKAQGRKPCFVEKWPGCLGFKTYSLWVLFVTTSYYSTRPSQGFVTFPWGLFISNIKLMLALPFHSPM